MIESTKNYIYCKHQNVFLFYFAFREYYIVKKKINEIAGKTLENI